VAVKFMEVITVMNKFRLGNTETKVFQRGMTEEGVPRYELVRCNFRVMSLYGLLKQREKWLNHIGRKPNKY